MNWERSYIFWISLTSLFACSGSEDELTQTRELTSFETIEVSSSFEIDLEEGSTFSVRLAGHGNRLDKVQTLVENGVLKIADENNVKWLAPENNKIELLITAPRFEVLNINETCSIRTKEPIVSDLSIMMGKNAKLVEANLELNGGNFYYWNNYQCGGRLTLSGRASSIQLFVFSSMSVDAALLTTDNALIESSSKGNCTVTVENQLEYSLHGIGNIFFRGNPQLVLKEKTSSGQLIKLD